MLPTPIYSFPRRRRFFRRFTPVALLVVLALALGAIAIAVLP